MDVAEWAHGRFRAARLNLPAVEIALSVDDCDGARMACTAAALEHTPR